MATKSFTFLRIIASSCLFVVLMVITDLPAIAQGTGSCVFGANEDWTGGPYFGTRGTFFADVTGDGRADAIAVNDPTVTVRRSTGSGFDANEDWTGGPYFGTRGTFFADVTGDSRADAIAVNDDRVLVRRSALQFKIYLPFIVNQ